MPGNLRTYEQMAGEVTQRVAGSFQEWTDFLRTAARLYKYPFPEQLLIYAQRPDATACAEYDVWNRRMRRYVRRGARGIALIDTRAGYPVLRYVFDVSDTGGDGGALNPRLWRFNENEHTGVVSADLEAHFGAAMETDFQEQLEDIANRLAGSYWREHREDLLSAIEGSYLDEYDLFILLSGKICHSECRLT